MNLDYEFSYLATLEPPVDIGAGPFGTRGFYKVTGGTAQGARFNGRVMAAGGDWVLTGPDGYARLDVRAQFLTDDGAVVYVSYTGLIELNQTLTEATAAGLGTDYADQYFRTTPRFETGDARYAWLNQSLFVAEGRMRPGGVEYQVYRVV
jgi:hypothetical protein